MGFWAQIKLALNSSLGRRDFLPLNEFLASRTMQSEKRIVDLIFSLKHINEEDILVIPRGTKEISSSEYRGGTFSFVFFPEGLTKIGYDSFMDCTNLSTISFPNTVSEIGMNAFAGADGLKSVYLGNKVEKIGFGAFSVNGLSVFYDGTKKKLKEIGSQAFAGSNCIVYCSDGTLEIIDGVFLQ